MLAPMLALAVAVALVQDPQGAPPRQAEALRVFLDCQDECDGDFLRTEVTFVNWVRDRYDGQILVLVTSQTTGGRGTDYAFTLIGQRELQGRADTLHYIAEQSETADERRRGIARVLRFGLARYALGTAIGAHLDVRFAPPSAAGEGGGPARERRDRWNRWVYRASLSGDFGGEESSESHSLSGSLAASRVTEGWKISLNMFGRDSRSRYSQERWRDSTFFLGPGRDTTVRIDLPARITRTQKQAWWARALVVRSLGAQWAAGLQAGLSGWTALNTDLTASVGAAIQYDFFPYAEATRRQLTFTYTVGPEQAFYREATIYGWKKEWYYAHSLGTALALRQPWGSTAVSVGGTQYWNDTRNPNVDITGNVEVRIARGLSLSASASYNFVRSQRFLSASDASDAEVLLQLRQLRTAYQYSGRLGLSYTFGSVYNNVVNPRLWGA
jgi:hypothetical protein